MLLAYSTIVICRSAACSRASASKPIVTIGILFVLYRSFVCKWSEMLQNDGPGLSVQVWLLLPMASQLQQQSHQVDLFYPLRCMDLLHLISAAW